MRQKRAARSCFGFFHGKVSRFAFYGVARSLFTERKRRSCGVRKRPAFYLQSLLTCHTMGYSATPSCRLCARPSLIQIRTEAEKRASQSRHSSLFLYLEEALTRRYPALALFLFLSLFTTAAFGQNATTSLRGSVRDPSSAVVPGAAITLLNSATGQSLTTTSNGSGDYQLTQIPPASYTISVDAKGFGSQSKTAELARQPTGHRQLHTEPGRPTTLS